ncbi:MAG: DUF3696 domain-containing protein [Candidatus Aminicenantes bacterium]|nr:DUF3696 domain-containing protein [Candidatus Aminicenantes bacterium]
MNKNKRPGEKVEFAVDFSKDMIKKSNLEYLYVTFVYESSVNFEKVAVDYTDTPILSSLDVQYKKDNEELETIEFEIVDEQGAIFYRVTGKTDNGFCKMQGIVPDSVIYGSLKGKERKICSIDFETAREYLSHLSPGNIKYLKALRLSDFIDSDPHHDQRLGLAGEFTAEIMKKKWGEEIGFLDESGDRYKFSKLFERWVKKLMGSEYRVYSAVMESREKQYRIVVEEEQRESDPLQLSLKQVGVGFSQLLPIITLILTSKENDVILIENPEVHLHPKLQAELVDLYLFAVENNRRLVVETHSDHVINRLRYRIKQNPAYLDKINLLFMEKERGVVRSTKIHISGEGKIDYWPENFFDQAYKDLLELIK